MKIKKVLRLTAVLLSNLLTSCVVITGLDPAEKLAEKIEDKAKELSRIEATMLEFDFRPSKNKLEKTPRYDGDVTLRVILHGHVKKKDLGRSVISVDQWYRTTYHNRFVWVERSMKQTKGLGDSFRIVLKKSDGEIHWVDLK